MGNSDGKATYDPFSDLDLGVGATARSLASFKHTDYGNAERLVEMYGDDMLWVPPWGVWLIWDGRRWRRDHDEQHVRFAKDTIRSLYAAAAEIDDSDGRQKLSDHARRSESAQRLKAMVSLATSEAGMSVHPDHLDSHPWLLNVENGTLDLKSGELADHDREHLITKVLSVAYDPDAEAPRWDRFVREVLPDEEERAFLQRAVGYSLTGHSVEEVMFMLVGPGSNGKSKLLEALGSMFGPFWQAAPTKILMQQGFESIPTDLARLPGARLVTVNETERGQRLAEAQIKSITSADRMPARSLYKDPFDFTPTCKIWLATNHLPEIKGDDDGIWRRILVLRFDQRIVGKQRDRFLLDKLRKELPGILRWAVEGCRAWQEAKGLHPPPSVTQAVADYRSDMDVLGQFLSDRTTDDPDGFTPTGALFSTYKSWCDAKGIRFPMTENSFAKLIKERGYLEGRQMVPVLRTTKEVVKAKKRGFKGLTIKAGE